MSEDSHTIAAGGTFTLQFMLEDRTTETYVFEAPDIEGYIIGRADNLSSYQPDIDLVALGAQQRGISRRHAALVRYNDAVHIIDLDSTNGTYVNGSRLPAYVACALKPGDRLSFANLSLIIS
ncbi:MAG: hypothetical protein OHK0046_28850 [Anaerolineae bacterium]